MNPPLIKTQREPDDPARREHTLWWLVGGVNDKFIYLQVGGATPPQGLGAGTVGAGVDGPRMSGSDRGWVKVR